MVDMAAIDVIVAGGLGFGQRISRDPSKMDFGRQGLLGHRQPLGFVGVTLLIIYFSLPVNGKDFSDGEMVPEQPFRRERAPGQTQVCSVHPKLALYNPISCSSVWA